jgi:hypothetical protein
MSDFESAKWGKADIDQIAVTNFDFMSTHPKSRWTAPGGWPSSGIFGTKIFLRYLQYKNRRGWPGQPRPRAPPPPRERAFPPKREAFGDVLVECEVLARRSLPHVLGNEDDDVRVGHILQPHVHFSKLVPNRSHDASNLSLKGCEAGSGDRRQCVVRPTPGGHAV